MMWHGLDVEVVTQPAGWEGDSSIPNGTRNLGVEVIDVVVYAPDGEDITDELTDEAIHDIVDEWMQTL
jgi:hypothetical protein